MKLAIIIAIAALFAIGSADLQSDSLAAHNKYRDAVGIPELTWSSSLAKHAQNWANYLAKHGKNAYSKNRHDAGENIATGSSLDAAGFVDQWAAEEANFIPGDTYPDCSATGSASDVSNYTQIVWESTTEVGCGSASSSGVVYYVCQYSPAGNIDGQEVYTVAAPEGQVEEQPQSQVQGQGQTLEQLIEEKFPGLQQQLGSVLSGSGSHQSSGSGIPSGTTTGSTTGTPTGTTTGATTGSTTGTSTGATTGASTGTTTGATTGASTGTTTGASTGTTTASSSDTASGQKSGESDSAFISDSLAAHNNERSSYGIAGLAWNNSLAQSAQAYANSQAQTGNTGHSSNRVNVGENLAWGSGSKISTTSLAQLWLNEKQYFIKGSNFPDCSTTGSWHDVAHYTQLLWRKTTSVGCGMGKSSSGEFYYVCHYYPQGNINGNPVY